MSNYGIFRIQKYDGGAIRGIEKHVQREASTSNTNPDINFARSSQNYNLQSEYQGSTYKSLIQKRLQECGIEKVRKNGVQLVELLFTASPDFFKSMNSDEIRQYFQECYNWAKNKYGEENIISAMVHLDEKTPHLHLEFVPICKNKLNARELFKRPLTEIQNEVHQKVFSKYNLERGETNQQKKQHISTLNYKILTLEEKIRYKQKELTDLETKLNNNELYQARQHIKELSNRLNEMMSVIQSDPDLMNEYLKARDIYYKKQKEENELEL